jgi:site-specific DNA-methyltransferase (adenine-specific)
MIQPPRFSLRNRNPDVLSCIANLSNDEVFTPPELANRMLDTLAEAWAQSHCGASIWADPNVRFLDPCTKSGVFLREITSRLNKGLEDQMPDVKQRIEHILTKQVFGIAITKLTSMLARRSLYCSKFAKGKHSVVQSFKSDAGNVWFERTEHTWVDRKCEYCGAGQGALDRGDELESHAYAFIHCADIKSRMAELFGANMQFDVIIGNPPYQIEADESGQNIVPIYNKFLETAKSLGPRFITMVLPARWMAGGKFLDVFRSTMLADSRIRAIVDFPNAAEAFPGVDIKGGVCYLLWNRDESGECSVTTRRGGHVMGPVHRRLDEFDVFVRDSRSLEILRRVLSRREPSLIDLVSTRDPFGPALSSNFTDYHSKRRPGDFRLFINQADRRGETWVAPSAVTKNHQLVGVWKVLMPKAGPGNSGGHVIPDMVLSKPIVAEPDSVCTLSYVVVGPVDSRHAAQSLASYLRTRFLRFLVSLRKPSQDAPRGVYAWVPIQQWDREWTDRELFEKYGITTEEQKFIADMIRPMEESGATSND